jgi:AcrR family transcriptional regulator
MSARSETIAGVREWVPVSTSAKGRLALRALEEFGRRGYADVGVAELAEQAGVTTGSLYHHFGSKLGLYAVARAEAERRLLDRMEGAAAARAAEGAAAALRAALLVGFDFVVAQEFARLLGEAHPDREPLADPVARLAAGLLDGGRTPIARMIAAAWREALAALGDRVPPDAARAGLAALSVGEPPGVSPPRSSRTS